MFCADLITVRCVWMIGYIYVDHVTVSRSWTGRDLVRYVGFTNHALDIDLFRWDSGELE